MKGSTTMTTQKQKKPRPFHYDRQREAAHTDTHAPCACCGHSVCTQAGVTTHWVHVVDGGVSYGGAEDTDDPGDMGWFAVGPTCAKRLQKAGVYVQTNQAKTSEQQLRDALTSIARQEVGDPRNALRAFERLQTIARDALRATEATTEMTNKEDERGT